MVNLIQKVGHAVKQSPKTIKNAFIISNVKRQTNFRTITVNKNRNPKLIVSLTSYKKRFPTLALCLKSLLKQTLLPDRMVLYLSNNEKEEDLPSAVKDLQKYGLEIKFVDLDLKPHKKYYYVLRDYPNDHLITFDDDLIYPTNTISSIMEAATMYPDCVVGRYSNQVGIDDSGNVRFIRNKNRDVAFQPSWSVFIGSGGGTLFPAGFLPEIAKDKDTFMSICRTADDVWLNSMCRYSGHRIVAIMNRCPLLEIINKNNSILASINYGEENYRQQMAVREYCIANGKDPFEPLIAK